MLDHGDAVSVDVGSEILNIIEDFNSFDFADLQGMGNESVARFVNGNMKLVALVQNRKRLDLPSKIINRYGPVLTPRNSASIPREAFQVSSAHSGQSGGDPLQRRIFPK
jgi:hypothetical protein